MGIQGLNKLVTTTKGVCEDVHFHSERLVIDGSNLVYHLYFTSGLDQARGGEYGAFKDLVTKFINALRTCDIRPYVVFDGCADFSDQKWLTQKMRAVDRVQKAHDSAVSGENKGVLPTLIWEVFRQTLQELKVPLARSYTEADQQAAALAQAWGCSVLSNDSDFFIFPITRGILPTAHFKWENVQKGKEQSFIPSKRYFSSCFCEAVNISPQLLPAFAVLAGNDYTRNTAGAGPMRPGQQQRAPFRKLQDLLQWLSGFGSADPQTVFGEALNSPLQQRMSMRSLQEAADHYRLPSSSLSEFFDQNTVPPLPQQMEGMVPDWMRLPVTEARFSSDFLDVLINKRVGLSVLVDHKNKPSANQESLPLRRALYGLLLGQGKEVEERDRDGLNIIINEVQTDPSELRLESLQETEVELKKQVLLKALGVTEQRLSTLPSDLGHLALPLAATCFCLTKTTPPRHLMEALLIGWCTEPSIDFQNIPTPLDPKQALYHDMCHWLNQWQSCLRDSFLLNQLLEAPLPEPSMARLFNGTLVHHLFGNLRKGILNLSQSYKNKLNSLLRIAQNKQEISPVQGTTAAAETVASDQQPASSSQSQREARGPVTKRLKTMPAK